MRSPQRTFFYPIKKVFRVSLSVLLCTVLAVSLVGFFNVKKAAACPNCVCVIGASAITATVITQEGRLTREHITDKFEEHRQDFFIEIFFKQHLLAAMMMMTEQLTTVSMQQMMALGAMFDAKHQLETQRILQQLTARAHKDYQPSTEMCTIGTAAMGLASASRNGEFTSSVMSKRSLDRQLGASVVNKTTGPNVDSGRRLSEFINYFCDIDDNNSGLGTMCETSAPAATRNKDVDYTRLIDRPLTLDIDFSEDNGEPTGDERAVLAMANNLYAHELFSLTPAIFITPANQDELLDVRSVVAKRNVAEHSFNSIVGMKAAGTAISEQSAPYLGAILQQLGIPEEEALVYLGTRPSYHAQMELLTKKIYQNPAFYTNLYDKPANVARKGTAIRTIGLIQNMDMFKSRLRNEAMLSVLLELEVAKEQEAVQNSINELRDTGQRLETQ